MKVIDLVRDSAKIDELLSVLDKVARNVDGYEYGLPIYDNGSMALLREAVLLWLAQAEDA